MTLYQNADFKDDPELYVFPKLKYVGVELWQVNNNIMSHITFLCLS